MENGMKTVAIVTLALTLAGCAYSPFKQPAQKEDRVSPSTEEVTRDFNRSKLIATDFVANMVQFTEINPYGTILHTEKPPSRFGELLLEALQQAGYELRVGTKQSENWLVYNANRDLQLSDTDNPVYTFIVAAGELQFKRSYEVDEAGVRPTTSMFVRGSDANTAVSDDSIFDTQQPKSSLRQRVARMTKNGVQISAVPTVKPFRKNADQEAKLQRGTGVSGTADYKEFSNMYDTDKSRYEALFADYVVVDSNVLVFANDSLILGQQNKQSVLRYASTFNPETDVMSVIGCSHGATNIENGNGYLANGRAFRVKEEFVAAGLAAEQVLEEGCWANEAFPKMPARGVLVQHKRLAE